MSKKKLLQGTCIGCATLISFTKGEKPMNCPSCGYGDDIGNWKKPPTETALFLLQNKFLAERLEGHTDKANDYLGEIFILLQQYAKGKTKKILKGNINYDEERLDVVASKSANLMIHYYLTKPTFRIDTSFGSYLDWQIKSTLYNKKTRFHDSVLSLNSIVNNDIQKEKLELQNYRPLLENSLNYDYLYAEDRKSDLVQGLVNINAQISKTVRKTSGGRFNINRLICLKQNIRKGVEKIDANLYNLFGGLEVRNSTEKTLTIFSQFINEGV